MITTVEIEFEKTADLSFSEGPALHGFIMENIDYEYANILHQHGLKPFSQYVFHDKKSNRTIWKIMTHSIEAYEKVIIPLMNKEDVHLKNKGKTYKIERVDTVKNITYEEIIDNYMSHNGKNSVKICFLTPTAFKSDGKHKFFPEISHIYKSLCSKWNAYSDKYFFEDEDMNDYVIEHTEIVNYNLKSGYFFVGKVGIKSFTGSVTFNIKAPKIIQGMAGALFRFAEFSGIGVKTSLGMGGVRAVDNLMT